MHDLPHNKILLSAIALALLLSMPTFLYVANVQQDLRTEAAKRDLSCSSSPQLKTLNAESIPNTTPTLNKLKTTQASLRSLLKRYQSPGGTTDTALKAKLRQTADSRKQLLTQMIQQNPSAALSVLAQNKDVDKTVSALTTDCAAEPTTVTGTLHITHADYKKRSKTFYTVITSDKKKHAVYLTGDSRKALRSQMSVKVAGYQLDNNLLVDTRKSDSITRGIDPSSVDQTKGEQKMAVILVNTSQVTKAQVQKQIFTTVNNYYTEVSYDQISLSGQVYGPYNVADQGCNAVGIPNFTQDVLNTVDPDIDFSGVTRIMIVSSYNCGWGGYGMEGMDNTFRTKETTGPLSVAWVDEGSVLTGIPAHELGHNFDVDHAGILACGKPGICDLRNNQEYGNPYDVMGSTQYFGQMGAPHRDFIGWFKSSNIQTVQESGTFKLAPIEDNDESLKALKIPRGNDDYLYVEFRRPIGFDKNFQNMPRGTNAYVGATLQVLINPQKPTLIDMVGTGMVGQTALQKGQSFTDPETQTVVKVTDVNENELTVDVDYHGPEVSVTPAPTDEESPTPEPCEMTPTPDDTSPVPTSEPLPTDINVKPTRDPNRPRKRDRKLTPTESFKEPNVPKIKIPKITVTVPTPDIKKPVITVTVPKPRIFHINFPNIFPFNIGKKPIPTPVTTMPRTGKLPRLPKITVTVRNPAIPDIRQQVNDRLHRAGVQSQSGKKAENPCDPTPSDTPTDSTSPSPDGSAAAHEKKRLRTSVLSILDYNLIVSCYSDVNPPRSCSAEEKSQADLNGDGDVNQVDYNLFVKQLAIQEH